MPTCVPVSSDGQLWGGDLTNIEHCVPRPYNCLERHAVRPVPPLVGQHVEIG